MKFFATHFGILPFLLMLNFNTYSQILHLDVEGDAKIRGRLDLADDPNTLSVGSGAGINNVFPGYENTFVGISSGRLNVGGNMNSFYGYKSGRNNEEGS